MLVAVLAGCSSAAEESGPAVPSPAGKTAEACRALHAKLPERVLAEKRTKTEPRSEYTANWGDPRIELRCGVPEPEVLQPESEHYNPTSEGAVVNGVHWLFEERADGYRFTSVERLSFVEVTVPDEYAPEVGALTDLATALRETVPKTTED
ncbi:hypothetical protein AN216_25220 [Streptomyces oceani]|uniref:DUF3515 domain-containing protein n=1 Tax=Streptomyces oceani TaxID=1075402 RepID=A0A1E7JRQ6_9ACTN|nr:hypothetical protein AN216_25220 [Streptomyces oceani]